MTRATWSVTAWNRATWRAVSTSAAWAARSFSGLTRSRRACPGS